MRLAPRISLLPFLVAALAVGSAAPTLLHAQEVSGETATVGVLDFTGLMMAPSGTAIDAGSISLGKAVASMVITELMDRPGLTLIERQDLRKVIEEQRLALSGIVDEDTAIEVGRILGAQYMIIGTATSAGGTLRLDLRVVDVETSAIGRAQKLTGTPEELLEMVVRAADRFAEDLALPPLSERPEAQPVPVMATIEFSRGLDFEDRGEVEEARARFCRVLELHPTHRDARRGLERVAPGEEDPCGMEGER